jgi:hypothetical protein
VVVLVAMVLDRIFGVCLCLSCERDKRFFVCHSSFFEMNLSLGMLMREKARLLSLFNFWVMYSYSETLSPVLSYFILQYCVFMCRCGWLLEWKRRMNDE